MSWIIPKPDIRKAVSYEIMSTLYKGSLNLLKMLAKASYVTI